MASISNLYFHKLDYIVNEYNSTYDKAIRTKPINVTDNTYINFDKGVHDKDPKFKIFDQVGIWKYKNIFAKGYTPNWF